MLAIHVCCALIGCSLSTDLTQHMIVQMIEAIDGSHVERKLQAESL